jgi:hypothetical protein
MTYYGRDSYRRQSESYSYKRSMAEAELRELLGKTCPEGHRIVGYRGKDGIARAYCVVETKGAVASDFRLQFRDHSKEGFWVDGLRIIEKASQIG